MLYKTAYLGTVDYDTVMLYKTANLGTVDYDTVMLYKTAYLGTVDYDAVMSAMFVTQELLLFLWLWW